MSQQNCPRWSSAQKPGCVENLLIGRGERYTKRKCVGYIIHKEGVCPLKLNDDDNNRTHVQASLISSTFETSLI